MLILQKFGFKDSAYARPQDKWVCGRLVDGNPCSLGPTGDGCCQVTSVCRPALEDGRWQCRRGPNDGGPCEAGPLPDGQCCQKAEPCAPTPNLRTRRKRLALWATTLAVGLIALALGSEQATHLLMPGPLSSPHASQTECRTCHLDVETNNLEWLHTFAATADPLENAKLCIGCHKIGDDPFSPHTHPVEQLRQMTAHYGDDGHEIKNESLLHQITLPVSQSATPQSTGSPGDNITVFCATCHQEHQGTYHDQTVMSDQRCQTCHTSKFGAFATSHPEFKDYPFNRRTRIIFNHKSHFGTHFPKSLEEGDPAKTPPEVCADCHRPGVGQKYMEIRGYEPMCASCHNGDILGITRATGPKGVDFLAVPDLDVATLSERNVDIGGWPEDSEAELTAFLRALIAAEPGGADVIKAVEPLDLLDLTDADDSDLANVKSLAWAIKALFHRLQSQQLSEAVMTLPDNLDGSKIDRVQMARLTGIMSHDVIMAANREWFPDLADDLARKGQNQPTKGFALTNAADVGDALPTAPVQDPDKDGAGTQDNLETEDKQADDLRGSLEPVPEGEGLEEASDDLEAVEGLEDEGPELLDDGSGNAEADLEGSDDSLEGGTDTAVADDDRSDSDENLEADAGLVANEGDDLETDSTAADDDILGGDDSSDTEENLEADASLVADEGDDLELAGSETGDGLTEVGEDQSAQTVAESNKPFDPETWAEFGGWYRQDFSIRYRPSGHSDRFLRTWLDYSGHAIGSDQQSLLAPIFDTLAGKDALGRCAKCHSIDNEDGYKHVKWRAFSTRRVKNRFTTFSHEPHISASGNQGCVLCHQLSTTKADYLKTYEGGAVGIFAQNFKPIEKATCSDCHTARTAGEGCTLCHNYHAAEFSRPLVKTKLP